MSPVNDGTPSTVLPVVEPSGHPRNRASSGNRYAAAPNPRSHPAALPIGHHPNLTTIEDHQDWTSRFIRHLHHEMHRAIGRVLAGRKAAEPQFLCTLQKLSLMILPTHWLPGLTIPRFAQQGHLRTSRASLAEKITKRHVIILSRQQVGRHA